jgi:DNA helicase II / ATP-dependent DNA helicase PcrA
VAALTEDALLDGLNDAQRAAVTTDTTPLCILAGAGSGKTRVLTRRIAYRAVTGRVDPRRVLALTFTRKAASELTTRLRSLGLRDSVGAGTFHAVAYAQLRTRWAERDVRPPELLDRKVGFVARLIPRSVTAANRNKTATLPLDVVSEIEWAKARMITPADYPKRAEAARRTPPVDGTFAA